MRAYTRVCVSRKLSEEERQDSGGGGEMGCGGGGRLAGVAVAKQL